MADPLMRKAAPQFIRQSLTRATPEERLSNLLEVYELLEPDERTMLFEALARQLAGTAEIAPLGRFVSFSGS